MSAWWESGGLPGSEMERTVVGRGVIGTIEAIAWC